MSTQRFNSLEEALGSMPRELQPERDLWPGIARRLEQGTGPGAVRAAGGRRPQWPWALAASLGVLALAGALCWSVVQQRTSVELTAQRAAAAGPGSTLVSFGPPRDADYVAARAGLERTFNERLSLLAPITRTRVQADLAVIRKANEDIRAALAQDPASPLLWQLLRSTWQQEIDLYTNVAHTTEPMLRRT
jgi:hypothetical protein